MTSAYQFCSVCRFSCRDKTGSYNYSRHVNQYEKQEQRSSNNVSFLKKDVFLTFFCCCQNLLTGSVVG